MLMTAFAPRANATVLVYFNFEDAVSGGAPDFTSDVVGAPILILARIGAYDNHDHCHSFRSHCRVFAK